MKMLNRRNPYIMSIMHLSVHSDILKFEYSFSFNPVSFHISLSCWITTGTDKRWGKSRHTTSQTTWPQHYCRLHVIDSLKTYDHLFSIPFRIWYTHFLYCLKDHTKFLLESCFVSASKPCSFECWMRTETLKDAVPKNTKREQMHLEMVK